MTEELRKYELMVIFSGEIPETQYEKELGDFKKSLQEVVKTITHEDNWGIRNLAYKIKRQNRGYYVVFNFQAEPKAISELRTSIRLNQAILRHMLITVPDSYEPGHHEDVVLFRDEQKAKAEGEEAQTKRRRKPEDRKSDISATTPREAEQLKTVEKKLEKILENPDLDIQ